MNLEEIKTICEIHKLLPDSIDANSYGIGFVGELGNIFYDLEHKYFNHRVLGDSLFIFCTEIDPILERLREARKHKNDE